jgi:hypothetical protein
MNRLIPASQVAKEIVASIEDAQKDLSEAEMREFMKELVEWLYQLNGFPPSGPKDN